MSSACALTSSESFTYTPVAAGDGVLVMVGCADTAPTAVSLSALNWSFTQVGSIVGSNGNWIALFKAYSPNTSQATITQTWTTGSGSCQSFMNDLVDEWSGVDATNFVDAFNTGQSGSGSCSVNVTPNSNNAGLSGFCQDSVTAPGGGFTKGADDTQSDWSEYKVLSGGGGVSQTVDFTGSGIWEEFAVAVKPTAQTGNIIMASSTPAIATGRVKYRLSVPASQAAGTYSNTIVYTITATY